MLIALDYDGTYTADPDLWQAFIAAARSRSHQVFVVTMRHEFEGDDVMRQLHGKVDRIVFTARRAKRPHMEFLGHQVQIWIDDRPHWVENDAADASPGAGLLARHRVPDGECER
jgi:hypothetical protein